MPCFGKHSHIQGDQRDVDPECEVRQALNFFGRLGRVFLRRRLVFLLGHRDGANVTLRTAGRWRGILLILLLLRRLRSAGSCCGTVVLDREQRYRIEICEADYEGGDQEQPGNHLRDARRFSGLC